MISSAPTDINLSKYSVQGEDVTYKLELEMYETVLKGHDTLKNKVMLDCFE